MIIGVISSGITTSSKPTVPAVPKLINFRVENDFRNRIYFDSTGDVTGLTTTGFKSNDKTVTGISLNGSNTLSHYLTVNSDFKYGEVINVEYLGGNGKAESFPKNYVLSKLIYSGPEKWVTVTGGGSKDGTKLNPWSMTELNATSLTAPVRVNIKKGTYSGSLTARNGNSTTGEFVIYEGYEDTEGDMNWNVFHPNYGDTLNGDRMPYFVGPGAAGGTSVFCNMMDNNKNYIIFKNIQISDYYHGWRNQSTSYSVRWCQWDNCVASPGSTASSSGAGIGMLYKVEHTEKPRYNKCVNSLFVNWTMANLEFDSDEGFIYNVGSYSDRTDSALDTDYMIKVGRGTNLVVRGCRVEKVGNTGHDGHGIAFKSGESDGGVTTNDANIVNSYMIDNWIKNINGPIQFRRSFVTDCFAINNIIDGQGNNRTGGIVFRDGAKRNTVDRCIVTGLMDTDYGAVTFLESTEDNTNQTLDGNIVKNCIFDGTGANANAFAFGAGSTTNAVQTISNTKIYNNTFYNFPKLYRKYSAVIDGGGNVFTNNIFMNIPTKTHDSNVMAFTESYNDYWNFWGTNGVAPAGTGNISVNPDFEDLINYRPRTEMYMPRLADVLRDYNDNNRKNPTTAGAVIIVAEEAGDIDTNTELFAYTNAAAILTEGNATTGITNNNNATISVENSDVYSGDFAIKVTANNIGTYRRGITSFPITFGKTYRVTFAAKKSHSTNAAVGQDGLLGFVGTNIQLLTTSWAEYTMDLVSDTTGTGYLKFFATYSESGQAGDYILVDKISIKELFNRPAKPTISNIT